VVVHWLAVVVWLLLLGGYRKLYVWVLILGFIRHDQYEEQCWE
jgi:hypothetical protein